MENNLEDKINLLYNYKYSNEFKNKYKVKKINLSNISLDDIKFKHNKDNIYHDVINEIFSEKFKLIDYDENNHSLVLKRFSTGFSSMLSIKPYKHNDDINSFDNGNNIDSVISYILSPLVLNNDTKHILLPVINIDIDFQQISDVLKTYNSYENIVNGIENDKISNILSVKLKENFFKSYLLDNYLKTFSCELKPLLFQVIHTLAVLQKNFNGFKHNKLSFKNIFIYEKKNKDYRSEESYL